MIICDLGTQARLKVSYSKGFLRVDTRQSIFFSILLLTISNLDQGSSQYLKDIDRKEIGELNKIRPPAGAMELKLVRSFPTQEQEEAGHYLPQPSSFTRDPSGNYLIADTKTDVIYKYDSSGVYLGLFGRPGQGPGDLSLPSHIDMLDEIIQVHDVGNRRLQFFNNQGQYIKSVRLFKDYSDLVLMRDGQIIGAPLYIERPGEDSLIEVMASDGKAIRAFGALADFKYDKASMNSRNILINSSNEIIVVFNHLPIIRKYSIRGQLLQEVRLESEFSFQKEKLNRRMNSYLPDQKAAKVVVFYAAGILNDTIYLVDYVRPRMWIWAVDDNLRITRTYFWENTGDYMVARKIVPIAEKGQVIFNILGPTTQGAEERIHIFSPK